MEDDKMLSFIDPETNETFDLLLNSSDYERALTGKWYSLEVHQLYD